MVRDAPIMQAFLGSYRQVKLSSTSWKDRRAYHPIGAIGSSLRMTQKLVGGLVAINFIFPWLLGF